jgi:serine/threonine protein kinase
MYTNAVDIWALGKILQELVRGVPSRISALRGKTVPVNKEPALRLIDRMMQDDPRRRPTAAECLKDPWIATIDSSDKSAGPKTGQVAYSVEPHFKRRTTSPKSDSKSIWRFYRYRRGLNDQDNERHLAT